MNGEQQFFFRLLIYIQFMEERNKFSGGKPTKQPYLEPYHQKQDNDIKLINIFK